MTDTNTTHGQALDFLAGLHPCLGIDGPPMAVAERIFDAVLAERTELLEQIKSMEGNLEWMRQALRGAPKLRRRESAMLSDDDIVRVYRAWNDRPGAASYADLIRMAEAEVRKQDEALIRKLLGALEHHTEQTRPIARTEAAVIAGRKRLEGGA